ncbi:hypothetical protein OMAG_002238 [Candidatus Omnitrophus magneticus]|uniref:Uncharacterized protein n=1 Tax=Candidatus Omnitrophus magneticus TaxID=1609969 RepID=A0A0F0CKQ6_9BACT|nr:hypothetical protein OMAG_002238 [Candidatus Omnitrophus magneticus]
MILTSFFCIYTMEFSCALTMDFSLTLRNIFTIYKITFFLSSLML